MALNDPATLTDAYRRAGFRDVAMQVVPTVWRFSSLADALRNLAEAQPVLAKLLAELSEQDQVRAWAEIERTLRPFQRPTRFEVPGECLIAAGTS